MVGNENALLFLFISFFVSSAEVLFYATDMSLRLKKEYEKKKQFLVHVMVKKIAGQIDVDVPDLIKYGAHRTSVQVSTINGVSTIKYSYVVSFDKEGVYSFGKARVISGKNEFVSPVLEVVVSDRIMDDHSESVAVQNSAYNSQKKNYLEPFARLAFNHHEAFVGEQISGFLYVYLDATMPFVPQFQFALPLSDQYKIADLSKPEEGEEVFNGKLYKYVRWPFNLYPLKAGEVVVDSFSVEYENQDYHNNFQSIWDQLTHFFDKKRFVIKVPKLSLRIEQVPLFQGNSVQAVGQFKSFKAVVNPLVISEKEVSTVTLELVGKGNFDEIVHPDLKGVENVLLYESNSEVTALPGLKKKSFEYIIQPHCAGNLEIPSQEIITFDPIEKKHLILKTDAQTVIVKGAIHKEPHSSVNLSSDKKFTDSNNLVHIKKDIAVTETETEFIEQFKIPGKDFWDFSGILSSFYFFILFILCLLFLIYYFFVTFSDCFDWIFKKIHWLFAYQQAYNQLRKLRLNSNPGEIYTLLMTLFVRRLQPLHVDLKYTFLKEQGAQLCNDNEQKEWYEFCSAIAAVHFGVRETKNCDALFNQASFWIDQFKKRGL